jgi:WD40-like Beta Propeller Repeat
VRRARRSWRVWALAAVVAVCAAAGGTSFALTVKRAHESHPPAGVRVVSGASLAPAAAAAPASPAVQATVHRVARAASLTTARGPQLLFRNAIPDESFGKLAVASLAHPNATRVLAGLSCDRVYYAAGNGLCLAATGAFANSYAAKIFDAHFRVRRTFRLPGIPSRARVSPDGRLGAITTFVNGDSYAPGNFSTRTSIVEMRTGRVLANLERFEVLRDGKRFFNRNFNFWGVTFARDDDHFYATLGSGLRTFLVAGSIRAQTLRVIHTHVECPSLSPDGTRIAFKRSTSYGRWRIYVLDLATMTERPLAETNSVDDQVEWRDDRAVLYWRRSDIWVVPADGTGTPVKLVSQASSPSVVRTP